MCENAEKKLQLLEQQQKDMQKEIRQKFINATIQSLGEHRKWLLQCASFASGAIVVACSLVIKTDADIIRWLVYLSMLFSMLTIIISMWHLKNKIESDLNGLPKMYDQFSEMLQSPKDEEVRKKNMELFKKIENEPTHKTHIGGVVLGLLIASLLLLMTSVCILPVCKYICTSIVP